MQDLIIHGHFYQPPREDPWLELVPREATAAPDHDWNERITRQCYAPLAQVPVQDDRGRIRATVNAYAWCSYDIGPTLFRWFDDHAPALSQAIVDADRASAARNGVGNAMAAPYHHVILPLLSERDKRTEVRWGVRDFRRRFGREPAGMWLPEAAVDNDTLAVLAAEGLGFTVVGESQVESVPALGRPGRWRGAGGRTVSVFVYDGPLSHHLAFGNALEDARAWEAVLVAGATAPDGGVTIRSLATDGETFGHHHRYGDRTLAMLIDRLSRGSDVRLTSYAAVHAATPPTEDVRVVSPSSWSCPHGVDRWRKECGCRFEPGTSQTWRAPLRDALETLSDGITAVVERDWPATLGDPWLARDVAGPDLAAGQDFPAPERELLEASCHALAMFTSCAWFFDDLARLEPRIVLRHAARALEFLPRTDRERLEPPLLATLAQAHSNDPAKGNGADIWHRDVAPGADGIARLAASLAALRELAPGAVDDVRMPAHDWQVAGDAIVIRHRRTGRSCRWRAEPVTHGVLAVRTHVRNVDDGVTRLISIQQYPRPIRDALRAIAMPMICDAALTSDDRAALREGLLDPATARRRALAGAWLLVARDGLDDAGIVVHSVLDLFDLDEGPLDDALRTDAFLRLRAAPASHGRDALADRFGVSLAPDR